MNLRQLEYLCAVAEAGSFTLAARQLLVAQPSLSQQIKSLERELGGALLERLPSGVRLTAAGKAFLPEARAALTHADRARRSAQSVLGLETGEIEVATVSSITFGVLPRAFEHWRGLHPSTTITLREYTHKRKLYDAVRLGVGDVGVGPRPSDWQGPVVRLGWQELVVVLPAADPLARSGNPIRLRQLADHDWILPEPDHGLSSLVLATCERAGVSPRRTIQISQAAAAGHLADAGLGVTLLPRGAVPAGLGAAIRSLDPPLTEELAAFTRREWSPLAAAFVEVLESQDWERPTGAA